LAEGADAVLIPTAAAAAPAAAILPKHRRRRRSNTTPPKKEPRWLGLWSPDQTSTRPTLIGAIRCDGKEGDGTSSAVEGWGGGLGASGTDNRGPEWPRQRGERREW